MSPNGFIRSLMVGTAHKWLPGRPFLILTVYLDESGTSERTLLAGWFGHATDWKRMEPKWEKVLSGHQLPYFHAHEAYKRTGVCKGWKVEQSNVLFKQIEHLSHQAADFGLVVVLKHADYEQHYKIHGKRERGTAIPDSKYGLCFRMAISMIGAHLQNRYPPAKKLELHVVMESGNQNAGDVVRIFDLMKGQQSPEYFRRILGTLSFVNKANCYQVQAADSLAYTANGLEEFPVDVVQHTAADAWQGGKEVTVKHKQEVGGRARRPVYRLPFAPNQLAELRTHLFVKNPLPSFNFS